MTPDLKSAQDVRKMSDLYLELRRRIPVVAEQTNLGTDQIQEAQRRVGLSNEAVARVVHISEKTWRRWKKQGTIPTASLPAVARALRLELRELEPNGAPAAQMEEVLARVEEVHEDIRTLRGLVESLLEDRAQAR